MRKFPQFCLWLFISSLIAAPSSLLSKDSYWSTIKFEVSTALSLEKSLLDTSYFSQFSPPFQPGPYLSKAEQKIYLQGKESVGFNVAFAYFPYEKLGFQFQLEYGKPKISGKNTPYNVSLEYTLNLPPNLQPQLFTYERTYAWPDTEGHLDQLCLSLNAVARLPVAKNLAINVSGGLSYFYIGGQAGSLGYSNFRLEGLSLHSETYEVEYKLGTLQKLGLNLGAEFAWIIYGNLCFVTDLRFYGCPKTTASLELKSAGLISDPIDKVEAMMNLGDITINPSFYRINFGLKYLF